jgi:hypothetical protein
MGDEALEAWRAGGAANDGATWRQDVVVRGRGNDPRRGAAGKNPAAAPNSGAGPDGRPEAGCGQQKSSGQHPMGTNKTSKRGRERKSKMAQAANENKQTEALILRRLEDGCGVGTRRAGEGAGVASPAEHCAGVRPTDSSA